MADSVVVSPPPRRRAPAPVVEAQTLTPPPRRRAPPPAITAGEVVVPPPRRRPPPPEIVEAEHVAQPHSVSGRFTVEGGHRPLPIYWQHHGAPDYVKRHAEDIASYRKALENGDEKRIDGMTDQSIVNIYLYEDALRRFHSKPQLDNEQFSRLEHDMIGAFDNTHGGVHREIISLDGKDVLMRWHCAAGEIVRDSINAMIYFDLLKCP